MKTLAPIIGLFAIFFFGCVQFVLHHNADRNAEEWEQLAKQAVAAAEKAEDVANDANDLAELWRTRYLECASSHQ